MTVRLPTCAFRVRAPASGTPGWGSIGGVVLVALALLAYTSSASAQFGTRAVEHYVHFLRSEQAAYDRAVTYWERGRYFERI